MNHLIRAIDKSGLLSDLEIRGWIDVLPIKARPLTAGELADWLVERRRLTKFQAECLLHDKPVRLVYDEYAILDEIGGGGMGQVFKAMHRHMDRVVALKVMHAKVMESVDSVRRFKREVKAAARLSHPNIVAAFDAGQADNAHYLVMEYVEGYNLRELTKRETLDIATGVNFFLQAAKGLQYAHERGVIHRDIKPANLLVTPDGVIKILDMGIARTLADETETDWGVTRDHLTQAGVLMGTIDFMAPEQAARADSADQRSDVYSLGCTAFFTLVGREVYRGDTILQKLFAHQGTDVPSLRDERPDVPPELDKVIQKMIAKQPEERYQSMNEVIQALMDLLDQMPEGTLSLPDFEMPRVLLDRLPQGDAGRANPADQSAQPPRDAGPADRGAAEAELQRIISSRATTDQFIDFDEEQNIFRKGGDLGLHPDEIESLLQDMCQSNDWTRHRFLSQQVTQQFAERHGSHAAITKVDFNDAVQFLVEHGMRRKAAIEECLTLMLDNCWSAQEGPEDAWFSRKTEQFGLD